MYQYYKETILIFFIFFLTSLSIVNYIYNTNRANTIYTANLISSKYEDGRYIGLYEFTNKGETIEVIGHQSKQDENNLDKEIQVFFNNSIGDYIEILKVKDYIPFFLFGSFICLCSLFAQFNDLKYKH